MMSEPKRQRRTVALIIERLRKRVAEAQLVVYTDENALQLSKARLQVAQIILGDAERGVVELLDDVRVTNGESEDETNS